ncbi:hypothetical protein [Vibrio profundi]|uniref:hypothetical protein n=1 Tax=Vibrio profundi TaxID=1774960 RepID=UPI003736301B
MLLFISNNSSDSHDQQDRTRKGGLSRYKIQQEHDVLEGAQRLCSIHDPIADYAGKLATIQHEFADTLKIVMRTYFEKPRIARTRFGWKGFGIDPDLDGQHNIAKGITLSRQLLNSILDLHVPTATEFLDPNFTPYLADMICWGAIGARTTESQPHRQLVSGRYRGEL